MLLFSCNFRNKLSHDKALEYLLNTILQNIVELAIILIFKKYMLFV
ncbi:hypothetical protein FTS_0616 [Francisella tularensis subsp. holarctica FSC200]|nr:hypothetical protein FTS_0616 [Francisella tularensis subsp. holarctica FSC200]